MKLYIKNMVCNRCKMVIETELRKLGLNPIDVQLGEVNVDEKSLSQISIGQIQDMLQRFGFELLIDRKYQQINQIKSEIIELIHYRKSYIRNNLSDYLSEKLNLDYAYLSAIFSARESTTIEKYFMAQRIEKVKELLAYDEKSLSEIAYQLNYSSVAHLSSQFKKIVGQTPTYYKNSASSSRRVLDEM